MHALPHPKQIRVLVSLGPGRVPLTGSTAQLPLPAYNDETQQKQYSILNILICRAQET